MALVHEDQVAALEGLHRHADPAAALLLYQFSDLNDLHGVGCAPPQAAVVQVESPRRDAGGGKFGQVLFAQALVGRDEQDVIQRLRVVAQKLMVVQMQNQRLAAAGGHPVGQFAQIGFGEGVIGRLGWQFLGIAVPHKGIEVLQQLCPVIEQTIQDNLGQERGQILKIAQGDRSGAMAVDFLQMGAEVGVVAFQVIAGNFDLAATRNQVVVHETAAGSVKPLGHIFGIRQHVLVAPVAQEAAQPGQQGQAVFEFEVLLRRDIHINLHPERF